MTPNKKLFVEFNEHYQSRVEIGNGINLQVKGKGLVVIQTTSGDSFKAKVETETGRRIKVLGSDNGGEYTSLEFTYFLEKKGIHHQFTAPFCSQQNGVNEHKNSQQSKAYRIYEIDSGKVAISGNVVFAENKWNWAQQ
ncbi:Integrase [Theobroma cacao]|nr:Integrase [Theobroma cacao]